MNLIRGVYQPSVITQRTGPLYKYQNPVTLKWHEADEVPGWILAMCDEGERARFDRHEINRMEISK